MCDAPADLSSHNKCRSIFQEMRLDFRCCCYVIRLEGGKRVGEFDEAWKHLCLNNIHRKKKKTATDVF